MWLGGDSLGWPGRFLLSGLLPRDQCLWVRGEQRGKGQVRTGLRRGRWPSGVGSSHHPPAFSRLYCSSTSNQLWLPSALNTQSSSSPDRGRPRGSDPCYFPCLSLFSAPRASHGNSQNRKSNAMVHGNQAGHQLILFYPQKFVFFSFQCKTCICLPSQFHFCEPVLNTHLEVPADTYYHKESWKVITGQVWWDTPLTQDPGDRGRRNRRLRPA